MRSVTASTVEQWGPVGLLPAKQTERERGGNADVFETVSRPRPSDTSDSLFDGWTRSVRRPDTEEPDKPPRWPWSR